MKRTLTWVIIVMFMSAGCASEKAWTDYHQSVDKQTDALLQFAKEQEIRKAAARTAMMQHYTVGMNRAAVTPSPSDDTLLAFAWGVAVATPDDYSVPKLPTITPPDKTSDLWRAATPVLAMAVPFLYLAADGWGGNNGASYTATDNAKINISSENAGSLNTAGNDQTLTVTDNRNQLENDCIDCGDGQGGASATPLSGEGGEEGEVPEYPEDFECTTDGYLNTVSGKWYTNAAQTCSCGSWSAGEC